jgi:hypothetical protein
MSGQIVDASSVAAPRQRNTDDEKQAIKQGRIPANWKTTPAKLRHKDRDARQSIWQSRYLAIKTNVSNPSPGNRINDSRSLIRNSARSSER